VATIRINIRHIITLSVSFFCLFARAESPALWLDSAAQAKSTSTAQPRVLAKPARYMRIDPTTLANTFRDKQQAITVTLPLPSGAMVNFKLSPSPIMSATMAAKYPQMMSYNGIQIDRPDNIGRFSISAKGLYGMFLHQDNWVLVSPRYVDGFTDYISYYYRDALPITDSPVLQNDSIYPEIPPAEQNLAAKRPPTGDSILTYRLAVSATGEYVQAQAPDQRGSKADAVAEIMNLVNRINQVLLIDLAVQFELADNENILFTNPLTDPFSNDDAGEDIELNQQVVDDAIGNANYDIGHLLSTNPGGLAFVGAACSSDFKAQGYTGEERPQGERFYIDWVVHELGHQLGASHTFNASGQGACTDGQRNFSTSFEPGGGSTIMSYAGICAEQNLQNDSDPYFHAGSIEEIRDYVDSQSCGTLVAQNNAIPQIQLSESSYTIPANTPFVLSAEATDADDDMLSYTWEQLDAGGLTGATETASEASSDNGSNPLFRSFSPSTESSRYFPKLSNVLAGNTSFGETYPTSNRGLNFRLTVKDNKGGVNNADLSISVLDTGGSFMLNSPTTTSNWRGNSQQLVSWNTGETEQAPISCLAVDISLDVDGDNKFDSVLATEAANDGEHLITVPNAVSNQARLMLQCSDSVFYALNDGEFTITGGAESISPIIEGQKALSLNEDSVLTVSLDDLIVLDPDSAYPEGFGLRLEAGNDYFVEQQNIIPAENFNGQLTVMAVVNDGISDSPGFPLTVVVTAVNDPPIANNDSLSVAQGSASTSVNVLANDSDIDGDALTLSTFEYSGTGQVSISNNQLNYAPSVSFNGNESIIYTASDGQENVSASLQVTVSAPPPAPGATTSSNGGGGGAITWPLLFCLFGRYATKRKAMHSI
jgi:hypothetical protein